MAKRTKKAPNAHYSAEFKAKAIERIRAGKESLAAIASDLGVSTNTVYTWKKKEVASVPVTNGNGASAEVRLERKLKEVAGARERHAFAVELRIVTAERDGLRAELRRVLSQGAE